MPDDFFRVRLVCTLLDTCAMCFDRGSQRKKLENFVIFFHVCIVLPHDPFFIDQNETVLHLVQGAAADGCGLHALGFTGGAQDEGRTAEDHRGGSFRRRCNVCNCLPECRS